MCTTIESLRDTSEMNIMLYVSYIPHLKNNSKTQKKQEKNKIVFISWGSVPKEGIN